MFEGESDLVFVFLFLMLGKHGGWMKTSVSDGEQHLAQMPIDPAAGNYRFLLIRVTSHHRVHQPVLHVHVHRRVNLSTCVHISADNHYNSSLN